MTSPQDGGSDKQAVGGNRAADRGCPSCGGTGWATVRAGGITFAGGFCKCVGGTVWAVTR